MGKSLLYIFNSSDTNGKAAIVWDRGEYISSRVSGNMLVNLYALPGFMAEMYFSPSRKVTLVEQLTEPKNLERHLEQIQISDVLKLI